MDLAVDILNRLLIAEYGSLIHRLAEASPYVSWRSTEHHAAIQRMLADVKRHQHELAGMIVRLRGAPAPRTYPTSVGGVHYLKLSYLMPQVIAGARDLVQLYEQAGTTGDGDADALIARNLEDHRRHLRELEQIYAGLHQPA